MTLHEGHKCTCTYSDDGDGESGPCLSVDYDEACPLHGREADPEGWMHGREADPEGWTDEARRRAA